MRRRGFSLIELLVTIAIIALLIAVIVPALGQARQAAKAEVCRSNLKQMQLAWIIYEDTNRQVIPYTKNVHLHPNWFDAMEQVLPGAPDIDGTNVTSFNACPVVQHEYVPSHYFGWYWGYVINSAWRMEAPDPDDPANERNELKSWSAIRTPSRYPWFADPQMWAWGGSGFMAAYYMPYKYLGPPDFGVGAHHGGGTVTNVSFADGSVRGVQIEEVRERPPGAAGGSWFDNQ